MYSLHTTNQFEKDLNSVKRFFTEFKTSQTHRNYKGFLECHIQPDWLLIWLVDDTSKTITLTRTGTHSDLF